MKKGFKTSAIGIMSGTSLDGLDLCYVHFYFDEEWRFNIVASNCIVYNSDWRQKLSSAHQLPRQSLNTLDLEFGEFIGEQVNLFLDHNNLPKPDLVCSHGHTVFHEPKKGITIQIGDGQTIADTTGITSISDFRSSDVSLGGEGAPLVPVGDRLLFSDYEACLNLGGFSNISFEQGDERKAFDICPVNIVLNELARSLGQEFDDNGKIARSGSIDRTLLKQLNNLSLYHQEQRPSLSREWLDNEFSPILAASDASVADKLKTVVEYAANQIAEVLNITTEVNSVLITGGGTKNSLLVERISELSHAKVVIPETVTIDYKEALIFAFLGVLRIHNKVNVLKSVTGATRNSCSGAVHAPV